MSGMRMRLISLLILLCATASHAQQWSYILPASSDAAPVTNQGNRRTLVVSQAGLGQFRVTTLSPGVSMNASEICSTRARRATLEVHRDRQVLTVAPAMRGCPEVRLVIKPDGTGWEEQKTATDWMRSGARLAGPGFVYGAAAPAPVPVTTAGPVPAAAGVPQPPAAQKLRELQQMQKDGLITQEDYEAKKAEILKAF